MKKVAASFVLVSRTFHAWAWANLHLDERFATWIDPRKTMLTAEWCDSLLACAMHHQHQPLLRLLRPQLTIWNKYFQLPEEERTMFLE
jgi:hypothetical protein